MQILCLDPQAAGGAHPRPLVSSHKLGRPVGLASAAPRIVVPPLQFGGAA